VGHSRRVGSLQARPLVCRDRGDKRARAGPRGHRRGPDHGGLQVGVRGGQGLPRPSRMPERGLRDGQPRREERRVPSLRGIFRDEGEGRDDLGPRRRGEGRHARLDQAGPRRGRGRPGALRLARFRVSRLGPRAEDTHDPPPHPRRPRHGPGREQPARRGRRHGDPAGAEGRHGPVGPPPRPLRLEHLGGTHRPLRHRVDHARPGRVAAILQHHRVRPGVREDLAARARQGGASAPRLVLAQARHHERVLPGFRQLRHLRQVALPEGL
ncbi:MAG: 3',5'-cyclic-nucleotide phosphodiesterase, partial [uncultured Rubrobacteraceae bacterium]